MIYKKKKSTSMMYLKTTIQYIKRWVGNHFWEITNLLIAKGKTSQLGEKLQMW